MPSIEGDKRLEWLESQRQQNDKLQKLLNPPELEKASDGSFVGSERASPILKQFSCKSCTYHTMGARGENEKIRGAASAIRWNTRTDVNVHFAIPSDLMDISETTEIIVWIRWHGGGGATGKPLIEDRLLTADYELMLRQKKAHIISVEPEYPLMPESSGKDLEDVVRLFCSWVADHQEYILKFISVAFEWLGTLYETVPAFQNTWSECLGDLSRYRMAIEDEDIRDRETWASIARSWYFKAADKSPPVGRLYHHLAILARPDALQQIYYYCRSLNSVEPFPAARESVMFSMFLPYVRNDEPLVYTPGLSIDVLFTMLHALKYTRLDKHWKDQARQDLIATLDNHIGQVTAKWKKRGVYYAVTNISAWHGYGVNENALRQLFRIRDAVRKHPNFVVGGPDFKANDPQRPLYTEHQLRLMLRMNETDSGLHGPKMLTNEIFALALHRVGDRNVLPDVHVMLAFIATIAAIDLASHHRPGPMG